MSRLLRSHVETTGLRHRRPQPGRSHSGLPHCRRPASQSPAQISSSYSMRLPEPPSWRRKSTSLCSNRSAAHPPDPAENGCARQDGSPHREISLLGVHRTHDDAPCISYTVSNLDTYRFLELCYKWPTQIGLFI